LRANSRKRSWSLSWLLYPMCRVPKSGTVLTAASDQLRKVTYSPFECSFYNRRPRTSNWSRPQVTQMLAYGL